MTIVSFKETFAKADILLVFQDALIWHRVQQLYYEAAAPVGR